MSNVHGGRHTRLKPLFAAGLTVLGLTMGLASGTAHASGGAISGTYDVMVMPGLNKLGPGTADNITFHCAGGNAFGVGKSSLRFGAEGSYCWGENESTMGYGGVQIGVSRIGRGLFWSANFSGGLGGMNSSGLVSNGPSEVYVEGNDWDSFFGYIKPSMSIGLMLGAYGLEVGAYTMIPIHAVQWVDRGQNPGPLITPSFGVQISMWFGWFEPDPKPSVAGYVVPDSARPDEGPSREEILAEAEAKALAEEKARRAAAQQEEQAQRRVTLEPESPPERLAIPL